MIEYATASLAGIEISIINEKDGTIATRSLRWGSDAWANNNPAYTAATGYDNVLPASVYFAELERSWSVERFNLPLMIDGKSDAYNGTSRDDRTGFMDFTDGNRELMTGLAEAEELPIARSILNHMFGTAGYSGPRFVYRSWTELVARNWPRHYRAIMKRIS